VQVADPGIATTITDHPLAEVGLEAVERADSGLRALCTDDGRWIDAIHKGPDDKSVGVGWMSRIFGSPAAPRDQCQVGTLTAYM
jgi:hypothetical protein